MKDVHAVLKSAVAPRAISVSYAADAGKTHASVNAIAAQSIKTRKTSFEDFTCRFISSPPDYIRLIRLYHN